MKPLLVLQRLHRNVRGLALIEFALSLPIVVTLLLFGLETVNLGLAILRVHQIAATSADNAARVRDSINEADVNEVLLGGKLIGESMAFAARGRIILSDVMPNGKTGTIAGQTILWQRCTGALNSADSQPHYGREGKGANDSSLQAMGATGRQIVASSGAPMIFAEVTYRYEPLVSETIFGTPVLRSEASFSVRERASEALTSVPAVTPSVCTRYDL
ncbi:hypothetical protein SPMU_13300 [Sphingomonas mucosissima]|uniref:TadE-like protein n=2 Tax=Sphingomonas mucosissima TaxID=370959 RepID=A0A245ZTD4_9SPHN|nr:hypothetical protein SPMU_13300 [Sphingomonas mucosissima]